MCELVDGTVLSSAEAASVLADAVIEVVYFETPRRVIGVSRRRSLAAQSTSHRGARPVLQPRHV